MTDIMTPALGESVTEATVAHWSKKAGDAVKRDDVLVELETDKVSLEVVALADGILSAIEAEEGATVVPGQRLGQLGASGDASVAPVVGARAETPPVPAPKPVAPPVASRHPNPPPNLSRHAPTSRYLLRSRGSRPRPSSIPRKSSAAARTGASPRVTRSPLWKRELQRRSRPRQS